MLFSAALLAVAFLGESVAREVCPPGWSSFQDSCYSVERKDVNYDGADDECYDKNGDLVDITSKKENDFVTQLLSKAYPGDEETKAYIDSYRFRHQLKQPFKDFVNSDWRSKFNGSDDIYNSCILMSKDKDWSWVVGNCADKQKFVCERRPVKQPCFNQSSCYRILEDVFPFSDIQDKCKEIGGKVLEINSKEETDFINHVLDTNWIPKNYRADDQGEHVWLGATDEGSEGKFHWMSTKEEINYTNWAQGEPNNKGAGGVDENCVILDYWHDSKWTDVMCDGVKRAVACELPFTSGITTG